MKFWDRRARVKVGRIIPLTPVSFSSPLRIQFKVRKNQALEPSTCEITISNLSESTRNQLEKYYPDVELSAGYADQWPNLPIVFRGQARTIDQRKVRAGWDTIIQCGDGETAFKYSAISESWKPGTSIVEIMKGLAKSLQAQNIDITGFLTDLEKGRVETSKDQFVTGFVAVGNPLAELDRLLAPDGYAVSIQNGQLQVISKNGTTAQRVALISETTGLIGSPTHSTPDHNGLPSMIKVNSLLLPSLNPGDGFILKSKSMNGFLRVEKIHHSGDTHGRDWHTEIETRPLSPGAV